MIQLKDNIWIEGFDFEHAFRSRMYGASGISHRVELLYQGKTSEVSEEDAKNWTEKVYTDFDLYAYRDYSRSPDKPFALGYINSLKSIQSACPQDWCIIYKV